MKLNKFFMGILGALALTACSSDDVIPEQPDIAVNDEARFMTVSIRNASGLTRAEGEYEDGKSAENQVENIIFYFFDKDGNAINVVNGDKNYFICTDSAITDDDSGSNASEENVEKLLKATIVLSNGNSQQDNIKDLHSMVAILNYDGFLTPNKNMSLAELEEEASNYAYSLVTEPTDRAIPIGYTNSEDDLKKIPYLVMTSASFVNNNNEATFKVSDIASHVRDSEKEATADPVDIYVERLVAKVRLSTAWDATTEVVSDVSFNNGTYKAILLHDANNEKYTIDGKDIYVIFEGWGLHGTAQKSWLFKKIEADWTLSGWGTDGKGWNYASYNRSFWAENHPDVTNTTIKHFRYEDANGIIGSGSDDGTFFYCLENAADYQGKGLKSPYDPDSEITNRTQVFIKAKLVTLSDDKTASIIKLSEWGGFKYVGSQVITAMLATVNNDIYLRKYERDEIDEDGITHQIYSYISIPEDMVTLISGTESALWNDQAENDKRYLSYLSLKKEIQFPEGYENAFYRDTNGTRFDTAETPSLDGDIAEVNKKLLGVIGAKVWEDGKTYYYADLKHLGKNEEEGLYGIVRNHLYDVQINTITGLGTPVLHPSNGIEEIIIPQHTGQDAFYLGARVNILSWRIVNNNVSLDW